MIARHDRDLADLWVAAFAGHGGEAPSHLVVVVADMAQSTLPLSSAFVAEFSQRLSRQGPAMHLARTWLEHQLAEQGLSIEELVRLESQNQAADQVSVSHTINSLRFLGALDWREFVEDMSQVDQTLRHDPARVYGKMDFFTRDRYRHVGGGHCSSQRAPGVGGGGKGHPLGRGQRWRERHSGPDGPCGLLPDWERPRRAGTRRQACASPGKQPWNGTSTAFRWPSMWAEFCCLRRWELLG